MDYVDPHNQERITPSRALLVKSGARGRSGLHAAVAIVITTETTKTQGKRTAQL